MSTILDLQLIKRLVKGSPLTAQEMDDNLCQLEDAWNALVDLLTSVIGTDGKLSDCSVDTDSLCDRVVTQAKRAWGSDFVADDTGSVNTVKVGFTPAITAYSTKALIAAKIKTNNTGAATLEVEALGAKTIKKNGTEDLEADDLVAGKIALFVYDGTQFQLLNPSKLTVTGSAATSTQLTAVTDPYVIDAQHTNFINDPIDGDVKSAGTPATFAYTHNLTMASGDYNTLYESAGRYGQTLAGVTKALHSYADVSLDLIVLQNMLSSITSTGEVSGVMVNTFVRAVNGPNTLAGGLFYKNPSGVWVPVMFANAEGLGTGIAGGAQSVMIPFSGSQLDLRVMWCDSTSLTGGGSGRLMEVHAEITHVLLKQ